MTLMDSGERMLPTCADRATFWEHIERYRFACRYAEGREVADIACGEGYGLAALHAAGARSVVGIDRSEEACVHAARRYGLPAVTADAEALPFPEQFFDMIVSFETLEHLAEPRRFVAECARTLRSDGLLILSTPHGPVFRANRGAVLYHVSEWTVPEFRALLAERFAVVRLFGQGIARPRQAVPAWWANIRTRLMWRLIMTFCPHLRSEPDGDEVACAWRHDPVAAILRRESLLSRLANPFRVFPLTPRRTGRTMFLLALATRAKPRAMACSS